MLKSKLYAMQRFQWSCANMTICFQDIYSLRPLDSLYAEDKVSYAALSVVSIADFKVQQGAEVAEGVGSGLVWDRWPSSA